MPRLLTVPEAAKVASVSQATIYRRIGDGSLPYELRGTVKLVDVDELERAFTTHTNPKKQTSCRVIALANQKGGVGKTTTTANLAAALADAHYKVLAIDCDQQGNLTQALGVNPDKLETTLYNVLVDGAAIEKAILTPVLGHPRLSLIGANLELSGAERRLAGTISQHTRLRKVLEPSLSLYDFILLDCPPTLGLLTLNALTVATEIIIPVDVGVFALTGVGQLLDTIAEVRSVNPELTRVRALSSKAKNTNLSKDVREVLATRFKGNLMQTIIRESTKVGEAQARGEPITVFAPKEPVSQDYFELVKELTDGA